MNFLQKISYFLRVVAVFNDSHVQVIANGRYVRKQDQQFEQTIPAVTAKEEEITGKMPILQIQSDYYLNSRI